MKRKIPLILFLAAAAGLGAWFWHSSLEKQDATHLTLHGNVDIREVNLGFRVSGRVTEILKDEGDPVAPGDTIARIDAAPYEQEVAQAGAALAVAEAELARLVAGYRAEEIAQARAAVNELEATLANNQVNAKRIAELLRQNASPQQDYDNAATAVLIAEKRLQSAKAALDLLLAGYRAEDIEKARAQVAQNRAALETARIRLSDTTLAAPSAGTISTRALEPGAIAQAGATVFTLSLDNPVWLRAYINEPDLGKIAPGMTVDVFTDSRPGKPYQGKIGHISPRAEFTPKTVQTESLRTTLVYRLRITVTNPDNMLRQGMPVSVRVAPAENEKLER
ncbi:secretion protein HlyD [Ereboglobus luteus]|uniref:Secretion protein HlyD n=1 Tax=Ereboglobus luteus TaxID=1796921 RepID=A0A2U8E5I7_9BACT|nr:secretion protein HlyD [Ereboglobus luteus]AWI09824.1 secretion protein HlyD [Ereboglobus luteus]